MRTVLSPLASATERAFNYWFVNGYNKRTREASKNRSDTGSSSTLYTPGKNRRRPNEMNVNVDDIDMAVIRRTVLTFRHKLCAELPSFIFGK
jgi:hypothetical protein